MEYLVVAIDGVAASGKGTIAEALAQRFDLAYLDTGLLYRAVGYYMLQRKVSPKDVGALAEIASSVHLQALADLPLRTEEVAKAASVVAAYEEVREALRPLQKQFVTNVDVGKNGVILDGRDIGTRIAPYAHLKFFLTASLEVRANRRFLQLGKQKASAAKESLEDIKKSLELRDQKDKLLNDEAAHNPGCIVVDSTYLTLEETIETFKRHVRFFLEREPIGSGS